MSSSTFDARTCATWRFDAGNRLDAKDKHRQSLICHPRRSPDGPGLNLARAGRWHRWKKIGPLANSVDCSSDGGLRPNTKNVSKQHDCRAGFGSIGRGGNRGGQVPGDNVVWRIERRVNPAMPNGAVVVVQPRQLELQRIPVGVKDEVKQSILVQCFDRHRQAVRRMAPVWLVQLDAVPGSFRLAEKLAQTFALLLGVEWS